MDNCQCSKAGFCPKYNTTVSERDIQCCRGTSGLSPDKEEYYLEVLRRKGKGEFKPPSFAKKVVNFSKALVGHALNGLQTTSNAERAERAAICALCEKNIDKTCVECGCPIEKKISFKSEECPLNKWPEEPKRGGCGCQKKES
jgi:hypothetical protein